MIRSTRDPGPSFLLTVLACCVPILLAGWLAHMAAQVANEQLDQHVNDQVRRSVCADERAPVRPTGCEEQP